MESAYLIWLLVTPLIASLAGASAQAGSVASTRPALEIVHMLSVSVVLVLVLIVAGQVLASGEVSALNHWLRVDALGAIFVVIVGLVGFLAGLYSIGYIRHDLEIGELDAGRLTTYYGLFHFFFFTMLLAVTSNNIIIMWVAIEATTLSSAFLVGMYGTRPALEAAWKYVVICTVGVAFGLYGTILVYSDAVNVIRETGMASLWSEIVKNAGALDPTLLKLAFVFVLIGFGTKAGIFPMYTWLPDTYSEAPSPVSAMLSGVLVNCTLFVIIRFSIIVNLALGPSLHADFVPDLWRALAWHGRFLHAGSEGCQPSAGVLQPREHWPDLGGIWVGRANWHPGRTASTPESQPGQIDDVLPFRQHPDEVSLAQPGRREGLDAGRSGHEFLPAGWRVCPGWSAAVQHLPQQVHDRFRRHCHRPSAG